MLNKIKTKTKHNAFTEDDLIGLLRQTKNGNQSAYGELSAAVRSISYSYFKSKYHLGKLSSLDDADDLANDVFIAFAKQYQNIQNIENWLRRVFFLTFVNFYKKQKSKTFYEFNEMFYEVYENDDPAINVDVELIAKIIPKLKNPKAKIIKMKFWDGLKFNEIATKLNKNESAVKKMYYRTLEEIKNKLD